MTNDREQGRRRDDWTAARVFALSIHADYQCARSGACCTAGWTVPVETAKQAALGAAMLVPGGDGACPFFERSSRLCTAHRDHGAQMKPDACRHFPRLALVDDRGTHVTLSHFCPTAAGLLFHPGAAMAIVDSAAAFPAADEYEGLDARGEWPPLVHRALLFGPDAYDRWETYVVQALDSHPARGDALAAIATAAEQLRRWTPADGDMASVVERIAVSAVPDHSSLARYSQIRASARQIVLDAVPDALAALARRASDIQPERGHVSPATRDGERAISRYVAAKAFASWTAYQGRGVRTLVAEMVLADALVRDLAADRPLLEAIREADRLLVHLADRAALVERLGIVETTNP